MFKYAVVGAACAVLVCAAVSATAFTGRAEWQPVSVADAIEVRGWTTCERHCTSEPNWCKDEYDTVCTYQGDYDTCFGAPTSCDDAKKKCREKRDYQPKVECLVGDTLPGACGSPMDAVCYDVYQCYCYDPPGPDGALCACPTYLRPEEASFVQGCP